MCSECSILCKLYLKIRLNNTCHYFFHFCMWDAWYSWSMQMTRHFRIWNLHLSLHNGLLGCSVRLKSPKLPWDRKALGITHQTGDGLKGCQLIWKVPIFFDRPGINVLDNKYPPAHGQSHSLRALLFAPNFQDSKYLAVCLLFLKQDAYSC